MKRLLFVDDEPRVLQGLQRQLRPMRDEWDMAFVDGGKQALEFMAANSVDIIVSDMVMPGMDGVQLLTEVLKRHPQTVRIVLSGHADREGVMRLVGTAHQYLSKPCDSEELRQAVIRAFALRDLLDNERLKELTARIKHLPTLPVLYQRLNEELARDCPSIEKAGEIISRDIGMTAKILQLVNSAFFGLAQPLNSPADAALYLGLNTLRSLVLSLEIFSQYDQKNGAPFSLEALTRHSWTTAVMARVIAKAENQEQRTIDQCFLAGLLHDVGQLVLLSGMPEEYAAIVAKAKRENVPVWEVEEQAFSATHADVGAYLLALWGLPNPIIEAVALHHQPAHCTSTLLSRTAVIHCADVFAQQVLESDNEVPPPQLNLPQLARLGLEKKIDLWRFHCSEAGVI